VEKKAMKELIFPQIYRPAIEQYGEAEAIVDGDYRSNWHQHDERVARLTHALEHQLGIRPADRFAVLALNSHQYLELWHSAFMGAGVVNPLNLRLAPTELAYIIKDSGSEVVFTDVYFAPLVAAARNEMGTEDPIREVILIGEGDTPHDITYDALLAGAAPVMCDEPDETDPVVLMYTGGTTGLPKGVLIEHRAEILNMYHGAMSIPDFKFEFGTYLMQTPMFHGASMGGILSSGVYGGRVVFIPLFDPDQVLDLMEEHQVTDTVMVPTMIGMCLHSEQYRPSRLASLRRLVYGASPIPEATLDKLQADLPQLNLIQGYGMTEACTTATILLPEDHQPGSPRLRSVGKPAPGVQVTIQDEEGRLLPRGKIGEVCLRGGNLMREYWNKPEATAEAFAGGWYHSGDAGYIDKDGYVFLVDRVKDMIVTGGENVYSAEVESAISTHPGVMQVAVIGIPHEQWGEAVHAIVVLNGSIEVTSDDVITHARGSIAGYKLPKSVDFRTDPLPLSGAMKVLKRDLRAPFWEGRNKKIG
jgi:long-chain acyl-CoA synthetase